MAKKKKEVLDEVIAENAIQFAPALDDTLSNVNVEPIVEEVVEPIIDPVVEQPIESYNIIDLISKVANSYIGQNEIPGNKGFYNKDFQNEMKIVGWKLGEAWCAYFGELVWKEAYEKYNPELLPILDKLFSGSSQKTYNNFYKYGLDYGFKTTKEPLVGSLIIWQSVNNSALGHVGIVIEYDPNKKLMTTIEGNTNNGGSREGDTVAIKTRSYTFNARGSLKLRGFINPAI